MTRDAIAALLARYEHALISHDAVALAAIHADDGVMVSPTAGRPANGRDAIRQVYESWFAAFPDLAVSAEPPLIDGERTAQLFTLVGTDTGGFLGLPPTGKPFRLPLVFLCRLEGGLITHAHSIYDFSGMLIQLGVLKVKTA